MLSLPKGLALPIGGSHMDCARFGAGPRPLVILPGLTLRGVKGAELPLAWMYRAFTREYIVYVLDKKADIPAGYTVRDMAGDAARAMERLGLAQADVFGVSLGGMIAQYLAIDHPRLVRKLVLGVTASRTNPVMERSVNGWIDMARRGDWPALVTDSLERTYSEAYVKKNRWLLPLLSRMGKPKDGRRFIAMAEACLTCDTYPELRKITCPVFVIGGARDQVVTGRASEDMAAKLGGNIYLYPELGHAAYDEARDFNSRVLGFLRSGG